MNRPLYLMSLWLFAQIHSFYGPSIHLSLLLLSIGTDDGMWPKGKNILSPFEPIRKMLYCFLLIFHCFAREQISPFYFYRCCNVCRDLNKNWIWAKTSTQIDYKQKLQHTEKIRNWARNSTRWKISNMNKKNISACRQEYQIWQQ